VEDYGVSVRDKVTECCNVPDIAVIVTIDVVEAGDGVLWDLPQPIESISPDDTTAQTASVLALRRRIRRMQQSVAASVVSGSSNGKVLSAEAIIGVSETVSFVAIAIPEGVTVEGEKLHDAPVGSPEQLNETT